MRIVLATLLLVPAFAGAETFTLTLYDAIGRSDAVTIEGRVAESQDRKTPSADDAWWKNLWRNVRKMVVSERERADVFLTLGGEALATRADEEGYFRFDHRPATALQPGWHGERDPEIYRTIAEQYPQRVAAIYIRRVHPDTARVRYVGQRDLAEAISAAARP